MIYLLIVSLIWSFSFGLTGKYLSGIDSIAVATIRLGIAMALFTPFLKLSRINWADRIMLTLNGAVQFGLMYVCYIKAYQFIPSHLVALFSIMTPVYVVLIADFGARRFNPSYLFAAMLSVAGAGVIKAGSGTSSEGNIWLGFGLMQVAGLAFAFGQVYYRRWKKTHQSLCDQDAFALLYLGGFVFALISSTIFVDWKGISITLDQWKVLLYLGAIASGLGFFLWNKSATHASIGTLGAFNNVVVPLAILVSLFVFKEAASTTSEGMIRLMCGSLLIGLAVWLGQRKTGLKGF
ncbi:MAG: EamA family transporter [Verrucomicrobiota bacterium]